MCWSHTWLLAGSQVPNNVVILCLEGHSLKGSFFCTRGKHSFLPVLHLDMERGQKDAFFPLGMSIESTRMSFKHFYLLLFHTSCQPITIFPCYLFIETSLKGLFEWTGLPGVILYHSFTVTSGTGLFEVIFEHFCIFPAFSVF